MQWNDFYYDPIRQMHPTNQTDVRYMLERKSDPLYYTIYIRNWRTFLFHFISLVTPFDFSFILVPIPIPIHNFWKEKKIATIKVKYRMIERNYNKVFKKQCFVSFMITHHVVHSRLWWHQTWYVGCYQLSHRESLRRRLEQ